MHYVSVSLIKVGEAFDASFNFQPQPGGPIHSVQLPVELVQEVVTKVTPIMGEYIQNIQKALDALNNEAAS